MKNENSFPIQYIKGIGPRKAEVLAESGFVQPEDLLYYYPSSYISRESILTINQLVDRLRNQSSLLDKDINEIESEIRMQSEYSILARVVKKDKRRMGQKRQLLAVTVSDGSARNAKINFWKFADHFDKKYKLGDYLLISGKAEIDKFGLSFTHPEIETIDPEDEQSFKDGRILPNYKITDKFAKVNLNNRLLRTALELSVDKYIYKVKESLPQSVIKDRELLARSQTIKNLHFPDDVNDLKRAVKRMKFDELFYYQLIIHETRFKEKEIYSAPKALEKSKSARYVYDNLPFKLTKDQVKALNEIAADLRSGESMNRLLQGDVGSGKTITSLLSILMMIDAGYQCAIMAPTEILAEQHYASFYTYLKDLDINICLITSGMTKTEKNKALIDIRDGKFDLIVGTHALFLNEIEFHNLAYFVVDEQHRFGVQQRAKIKEMASQSLGKNIHPHILVMSATPIPRTLEMTFYGDLDVSIIKTKPVGRKEIKTRVAFESQLPEVFNFIRSEVKSGRQAFIVYPLIEKSEKMDLKSAEEEYERISQQIFPDLNCALLHGRMNSEEKDFIMQKFKNKDYQVLISTTVIEVGIDIPNANIMLIESAERFGLSQLHQLRGRVGRGEHQSYCILSTKDHYQFQIKKGKNEFKEQASAAFRLKTMEETNDGFKIAEADLKLRGPGDLLGTKQSGLPKFDFADIVEDMQIIKEAKESAMKILSGEISLSGEENAIIKENIDNFKIKEHSYFNIA